MKVIKYFDAINNEWISVEVSSDVASELKGMHFAEKEQKRQIASHEVSIDSFQNGEDYLVDTSLNPYEALIEKEYGKQLSQREIRLNLLNKALKKLNDKEWFIIEKIFWQNYKKIEISRKFNIIPSLITYRYNNAINKLKKYILKNEGKK